MSILSRLYNACERSSIHIGRTNARQYLLRCDDRVLADGGFSRELLERGNGAWPWRVETPAAPPSPWAALAAEGFRSPVPVARHDAAEAVAELRSMSDADLDDLGIARANIVEAVRDGRPGIDREAA